MNLKNVIVIILSSLLISMSAIAKSNKVSIAKTGIASWYGYESAGKTASGERFNPMKLTAAHRTLPFGTMVKVTNLKNKKSVQVKINDRGPFIGGRIIDLSKKAAQIIELGGTQRVSLSII
jgi:rare lipoprotein A